MTQMNNTKKRIQAIKKFTNKGSTQEELINIISKIQEENEENSKFISLFILIFIFII